MRLATILAAVIVAAGTHTMAVAASHATPTPETKDSTGVASTLPVDGEVRKVDIETKKITLKHGPIANLGMPAMSMVFRVKDAVFLEKVKAGDKVKFSADKVDGALTITGIQVAQ